MRARMRRFPGHFRMTQILLRGTGSARAMILTLLFAQGPSWQRLQERLAELGDVLGARIETLCQRLCQEVPAMERMAIPVIGNMTNGAGGLRGFGHQQYGTWRPDMGYGTEHSEYILAGMIIAGLILTFLVLQILNHRRRMTELRYKTLEKLAAEGKLAPGQIEDLLTPRKKRTKFFLLLGWFALLSGIMLMVVGGMIGHRDGDEMMMAGFCISIGATGLLATPIMLREFKKQGVL